MFGTIALPVAFLGMHEKTSGLDTPDVTFFSLNSVFRYVSVAEFLDETTEQSSESVNTIWEEVWGDATPGTEAGIKLYLEVATLQHCY